MDDKGIMCQWQLHHGRKTSASWVGDKCFVLFCFVGFIRERFTLTNVRRIDVHTIDNDNNCDLCV